MRMQVQMQVRMRVQVPPKRPCLTQTDSAVYVPELTKETERVGQITLNTPKRIVGMANLDEK